MVVATSQVIVPGDDNKRDPERENLAVLTIAAQTANVIHIRVTFIVVTRYCGTCHSLTLLPTCSAHICQAAVAPAATASLMLPKEEATDGTDGQKGSERGATKRALALARYSPSDNSEC